MKTEVEVGKRLYKLRQRYKHKYVQSKTGHAHRNCRHNYEHSPSARLEYGPRHPPEDGRFAARRQQTLVVIQPEIPARICTYGSDRAEWNGDICDTDDKSSTCPYFSSRMTVAQAEAEFDELLKDDAFVFDNYRDIAALQWVIDKRVVAMAPPLWDRFKAWLVRVFLPVRELPEPKVEEIPKGLWDVDPEDPRS